MSQEFNENTIAVALRYDDSNTAPQVTAKGTGELAEQIIAIAKHHGVCLKEDHKLVQLLSNLELGESIPEELYLAVAEIIAFTYLLRGKKPSNFET